MQTVSGRNWQKGDMHWLYDAHVHLSDPAYRPDLKTIIRNMRHMHTKACCVSMDGEDSGRVLELSRTSDLVLPFIGIHPERASDDPATVEALAEGNAGAVAGIGEIGLDPAFCSADGDYGRQRDVFERMLSLAENHGKPVSIHSRGSLDDVLSIMTSYSICGACLHWFDGNKRQLQRAMDEGFFVSYGPVMVYAKDKQSLLSKTRLDRILVETDGPVRFSRCFGLRQAQVSFIPSVVFCASKTLGMSYDETSALLEDNSGRFLGCGGRQA